MPFNLGSLAGGAVEGYDVGQSWRDRSAQREDLSLQRKANTLWGNTIASLGTSSAPQPPMPGQASQPAPPPSITPTSFAGQGGGANGVSMPQGAAGAPPTNAPYGQIPPISPQGFGGAVRPMPGTPGMPPQQQPSPPPQQGTPPPMGQPQQGMFSLQDVVRQIRAANPNLDPSKPEDARAIAMAAGNALPFMKQADQEYYKQLTLGIQQQRADTAKELGQQRADTAQQRADTSRDQGWSRIQQTSDKMLATAKMRQDNLALNYSRLDEAKRKGDFTQQKMIETQIKNDRAAKTQTVNSISTLLRSATPEQLKDPVFKADMDALQQQLEELKAEPSAQGAGGSSPEAPSKGPRSEDAAPAKSAVSAAGEDEPLPQPGDVVGNHRYMGPPGKSRADRAEPGNWVLKDRPSPPLAGG